MNDNRINLLDCTLRDGGYINDWEFGHNNLISIFERIALADTDIIEVGFIDDRRPFDINRSIFPDTESIRKIYGSVRNYPSMTVAMIDYGTCDISHIQPCKDTVIDGIRVIFKKHRMHEALDYCGQIKALGYKVFVQLVSITSYEEKDIEELAHLVNAVMPYAVSIVDTYGLLYPDTSGQYISWLDKYIDVRIALGFHAHNNLQLAYANSLVFINSRLDREKIIDGTIFGMGKSAGNAPIELISSYLNKESGTSYKIEQYLDAYDESINDIFSKYSWGYKKKFYSSSEYSCHPSYVYYLESKNNLSNLDINQILDDIGNGDIRLLYDRNHIEQMYDEYIKLNYNDSDNFDRLHQTVDCRPVLIIGPGKNIVLQRDRVVRYIEENSPIVISINYIPDGIKVDYVFVTRKGRYHELTEQLHRDEYSNTGIIRVSNISTREEAAFVFLSSNLLDSNEELRDNSFLMLLNILNRAGCIDVACGGLDGYSATEDNYFKQSMEKNTIKTVARRLNYHIRERITTTYANMNISFITYSHYAEEEDINNGGF